MAEQKLIKQRMRGQDTDFLAWVRNHPSLPSRIGETRLSVQDIDVLFHAFLVAIDRQGSREMQAMMLIETKSNGAEPDKAQTDTLWKLHQFAGTKEVRGQKVRFFGVFVLRFSQTSPANSVSMWWGRFNTDGSIRYALITKDELVDLLLVKRHPMNLTRQAFRRHHKTKEIAVQGIADLGFTEFRRVIRKS